VFIDVFCKYSKGFDFYIEIWVYVDAPVKITCIKVINQNEDDNEAAIPGYNSGGIGFNWMTFNFISLIFLALFLNGNAFPQVYNHNQIETTEEPEMKPGFNLKIDNEPVTHIPQNKHLQIGECEAIQSKQDQDSVIVYTDHTIIENEGPSTLNGTIE
uniref:CSON000119 protein n=1 Tax=Culicoides sonorensis TaxID=179676 RepID=A0A336MEY7_CULSO